MKTRKLTDDDLKSLYDIVEPIFDKHGGDLEAAGMEIRQIFYRITDRLIRFRAEKEPRYTLTPAGEEYIKRMEAQPHEDGNSETL